MNNSFSLEKRPLLQDAPNGEPLDTLDHKSRLRIGPALDTDHFTNGTMSKQILLSGLSSINHIKLLSPVLIQASIVDESLTVLAKIR